MGTRSLRGLGGPKEVSDAVIDAVVRYLEWRAATDKGGIMFISPIKAARWYEQRMGRNGLTTAPALSLMRYVMNTLLTGLGAERYKDGYVVSADVVKDLARSGRLRKLVKAAWG